MATENGYIDGPENARLFYQCWLPEKDTRAVLIVVHGLAEHSGRYMNLVNSLVPEGFAIYAPDHYGHGKSEGKRLFVPRFRVFTQGLDLLVNQVKAWEPEKPVFLVAHSMGGLITAAYLQEHQDKVAGSILSGPGVKIPDHVSALTRMAARLFSLLVPGLGITQLEAGDISRDPAVVRAYLNDPLVSKGKITARLASEMLDACERTMARAGEIRLPLMVLQGGADALVDPEGASQFHGAVGSEDKTLIVYPEKFHEIFNDPGYDQVFSDIETWLEKRISV